MQSLEAGQTEYRKPDLVTRPRQPRWITLAWLVVLLLGQYRRNHGGTDLLNSLGVLGMLTTMAVTGFKKQSDPWERGLGLFFIVLAVISTTLILIKIAHHSLHW